MFIDKGHDGERAEDDRGAQEGSQRAEDGQPAQGPGAALCFRATHRREG